MNNRCHCDETECAHSPGACSRSVEAYAEPRVRARVTAEISGRGPVCGECARRVPEERLRFLDSDGIPYL
jgi:hypothetical protein